MKGFFTILIASLCLFVSTFGQRPPVEISAIIDEAVAKVKPYFDRAVMQGGFRVRKDDPSASNLGMEKDVANPETDLVQGLKTSFCKQNQSICDFLTCTAENFRDSEDFSNLNLAAKVLTDPKLRADVSGDPTVMAMVCETGKLDTKACDLFKNGFQLIDKFLSIMERRQATMENERREALRRNWGSGGAHNLNLRGKREEDLSSYYGSEEEESGGTDTEIDAYYGMYGEVTTKDPKRDCAKLLG